MTLVFDDIQLEDYQRNLLCTFNKRYPFRGKKVLEIGSDLECKTALGMLALGAAEVWAVNPKFSDNLESPDHRIHLIKSLGENTKLINKSFDIVFGIALLEHVLHLKSLFNECKRLLKTDGICYLMGNPLWTCYRGHHIWCEKFKFNDETNPLFPWEHLCYKSYDEMHESLSQRGYCENDIKEIYNEVYVTDDRSRIYPSKIKEIAKQIFGKKVEFEQYSSNILPNQYYDIAKNFISEEDLNTEHLDFYFVKTNIAKKFLQNLFSVKNKDAHKIITILGLKLKFRRKNKQSCLK